MAVADLRAATQAAVALDRDARKRSGQWQRLSAKGVPIAAYRAELALFKAASVGDVSAPRGRARPLLMSTVPLRSALNVVAAMSFIERQRAPVGQALEAAIMEFRANPPAPHDDLEREALAVFLHGHTKPSELARLMTRNVESLMAEDRAALLLEFARLRLAAFNAIFLTTLAAKNPMSPPPPDPKATSSIESATAEFGARLQATTKLIAGGVGAAWRARLSRDIAGFEKQIGSSIRLAVSSCHEASAMYVRRDARTFTSGREAALSYDALRSGLARLGAAYALYLDVARGDEAAMKAWARASLLPTSVRQSQATGDSAQGLIKSMTVRAGGPTHRTVMTIERESGPELRALVPHAAVDSFGIGTGVWCSVSGDLHESGKDGIEGPVIMVGRHRLSDASKASFDSFLEFRGARVFPRWRLGLTLIAGRNAARLVTLNELRFWRAQDED